MKVSAILLALFTASYVSAHGTPTAVTIGGKTYRLHGGGQNPILPVRSGDPNLGVNIAALTCGPDAKPAPNVVNVNPGQTISIEWANGAWPHNTGPVMDYLGECVGGDCRKSDPKTIKWFKISQQGKEGNGGSWVQQQIMNGRPATVTIPRDLAPGEYLLRHEIIALHRLNGNRRGQSEHYPGCIQLKVGGNGNGRPSNADLLSFPGAYKLDDPGLWQNPYGSKYVFPGGRIAPLNGGGSPDPSPSHGPSPTDPPSTSTSRTPSSSKPSSSRKFPPSSSTGVGNINLGSLLPSSSGKSRMVCKTKKPKPSSSLPPVKPTTVNPKPTTSTDGYGRRDFGHSGLH